MSIYRLQPGLRRVRKPATSGGGFTPTDLATLSLWLDADDVATFTFGTGSAVATWNDKSSSGWHVSQATTGNRPARSGTLNSKSTVVFDGTNDCLFRTSAAINSSSDGSFTCFAVVVPAGLSAERSIIDGDEGEERIAQFMRTNGTQASCITWSEAGGNSEMAGGSLSTSTAYLLRTQCDGPNGEIFVDGVSVDTLTQPSQRYRAGVHLTIGARAGSGGPGQFWNGQIAEVITCRSLLSSGNITSVEDYLTAKWAL